MWEFEGKVMDENQRVRRLTRVVNIRWCIHAMKIFKAILYHVQDYNTTVWYRVAG